MLKKENNAAIYSRRKEIFTASAAKPAIRNLPSGYDRLMRHPASVESPAQKKNFSAAPNAGIFVKVDHRYQKIMLEDIYLVEALCDYMNIYTKEKRYTIHSTLYAILEKLPKEQFMRVHKSFIVRLDRISAIDAKFISVEDREIPVSKTYKHDLQSRLTIVQ